MSGRARLVFTLSLALTATLASPSVAVAGEPVLSPGEGEEVHAQQQEASALEQRREFAEAAARWRALASSPAAANDPSLRELAYFRAQEDFRKAYECGGDPATLCSAHATIDAYLEDPGIDARAAAELRAKQHELRNMLLMEQAKRGQNPCMSANASSTTTAISSAPLEGPRPQPERPRDKADADAPPRDPTPMLVAGGVVTGLGAALLGTMVYGIVEMDRAEERVKAIVEPIRGTLVPLSEEELSLINELERDFTGFRTLAIASGVTGALALASGVTMLVIGDKQRRTRSLALNAQLAPGHAGLTLRGRF